MINTDSYYEIGAGHVYCQDYADSGKFGTSDNLFHYAIVCDGCSGSKDVSGNNYTDIGARLLARKFPKIIKELIAMKAFSAEMIARNIKDSIVAFAFNLGLDISAFDATIVAIVYDQGRDELHTFVWGDGKVFIKYKEGDTGYLTDITYAKNAPFYLAHQINAERELRYEGLFGIQYADVQGYVVKGDGLVELPETAKHFQKVVTETYKDVSKSLAFASVFTDGIDTYHKTGDTNILMPRHNVFNQLTQYKNTHGEFVKRRMQMVKKFCEKEGWKHFDDISVATIVL
jgi:hypothetical protein